MGGPGHLPAAEPAGVGLSTRQGVEEPEHVGLGLKHQHRHVQVVADQNRRVASAPLDVGTTPGVAQRKRAAAPAVDQEAVEALRARLHPVHVRDQGVGRLRFPDRDDALDVEVVQRFGPVLEQRVHHLGEHVVGVGVTGVHESAVAERIRALQRDEPARPDVDQGGGGHDPGPLGRHADPDVAGPGQLRSREAEHRRGVGPAADVEPLDDDGPAETTVVARTPDQDPGGELGAVAHLEGPASVGREPRRRSIGLGVSRTGPLGLLVADVAEPDVGQRPGQHRSSSADERLQPSS